jgi:hypothetical protein
MCPQTVLASRRMLTHSNALVRVGSITGRCPWAQLGCACLVAGHDAWRCHCRDLGAHPTQFGGRGLVGFQNSNGGGSCDLASNVSHFSRFHRFRGHSLPSRTRWCAWSFALFSHTADMRWPHGKIHFTDVDPRHPPADHTQFVAYGYVVRTSHLGVSTHASSRAV